MGQLRVLAVATTAGAAWAQATGAVELDGEVGLGRPQEEPGGIGGLMGEADYAFKAAPTVRTSGS